MKTLLILPIFLVSFLFVNGQCKDVYEKPCDCPTLEDSLLLYINSISVIEFYDYNPAYKKVGSKDIRTGFEQREVFELMKQSRRLFSVIRKHLESMKQDPKFASVAPKIKYKDITFNQYYKQINKYRFNQRELENQIVNAHAPFPIYDTRIAPIFLNEYQCIDSTSEFFGDLVNIPMYIPIVVKPDKMLSDSERIARDELLKSFNVHDLYVKMKQNKLNNLLNKIKVNMVDTTNKKIQSYTIINVNTKVLESKSKEYITDYPVHFYGLHGGNSIIGFMVGRKFQKIRPNDYKTFAIQKHCKEILENEKNLISYLKIKFGDYFNGFYGQ
jgi:hypothetical protein